LRRLIATACGEAAGVAYFSGTDWRVQRLEMQAFVGAPFHQRPLRVVDLYVLRPKNHG
jgi:hypothetical protein